MVRGMPAQALPVDWNEVRTLAMAVGVREAARRMEISEEATMKRCQREGWLDEQKTAPQRAREAVRGDRTPDSAPAIHLIAEQNGLSANVRTAADCLDYRQHGKPARLALAAAQRKQAERLATMDEDELIQPEVASVMVNSAKVGNTIHGWSGSAQPATIRLELLARGAGNGPVIDAEMTVESVVTDGEDEG